MASRSEPGVAGSGQRRRGALGAISKRLARTRRRPVIEALEGRRLLAYSISATSITIGPFQFVNGNAVGDNSGDDSIEIKAIGGNVAYSLDGGANFSTSWAGVTIPVGDDTLIFSSVSITVGDSGQSTPGVSHSVKVDTSNGELQATKINIQNESQAADTSALEVDDAATTTPRTYTVDDLKISGTGIDVTLSGVPYNDGLTLRGGNTGANNIFLFNPSAPVTGLAGQPVTLVGGSAVDDFEVTVVPAPSNGIDATLTIDGNGGDDTANLGTAGNAVEALRSPVQLRNSSGTGSVALTINDSAATAAQSYGLTSTGIGLFGDPPLVDYQGQTLASIDLMEGSGGNTTTVTSTPSNAAITGGLPITISTGSGADNTSVVGTGANSALAIAGQGGADAVAIGDGDTSTILGSVDLSNTGGTIALVVGDESDTTPRTVVLGATSLTGLTGGPLTFADLGSLSVFEGTGGNTTTVTGVPAGIAVILDTGTGDDDTTVEAVDATSTLAIDGQGGTDTVAIGNAGLVAGVAGGVSVANTGGQTALTVDDSADADPVFDFQVNSVTVGLLDLVRLSGLPSADLDAVAADLSSLTVKLGPTSGTQGNIVTYNVTTGTFAANIFTGPQSDEVHILATAAGSHLTVDGEGGSNLAFLGDNGDTSGLFGEITLLNFSSTVIDNGADPAGRDYVLSVVNGVPTLSGLANGATVQIAATGSLQILAGPGTDSLTVDLANGNPIPVGGVFFSGGGGANSLSLLNGTVDSEVYTASAFDAGGGDIALTTGGVTTTVTFTGLRPIIDTVAATNYLVDLTLVPGPLAVNITSVGAATRIASGDSPSAFEMADVSNKQNITVNTGPGGDAISVNLPTASAGLETLTVNTDGGSDQVAVVATPDGVATFVNTQAADDTVSVLGAGLGGAITLDGGTGVNTLTIDAAGSVVAPPVVSPLTINGQIVTFTNFQIVNITNAQPTTPTITFNNAGLSVAAVKGTGLVNQVVARFTAVTPGVPTTAYVAAVIDWGDGTTSAGLVVPTSTTTVGGVTTTTYDVLGSHNYAVYGTPATISTTLTTAAADFVATVGGVKITTTLPGETFEPAAIPVSVGDAAIVATGATFGAVEGNPVATVVATFTYPDATALPADFAVTVDWGDGTSSSTGAGNVTVTAIGTSPNGIVYSVGALKPTPYLGTTGTPGQGTYAVTTTITHSTPSAGSQAIALGQAVVTDGTLTATPATASNLTVGTPFAGLGLATFVDNGGGQAIGDYTISIDWGDGTSSPGVITGFTVLPGGNLQYSVAGTHTYATAGTFFTTTTITSSGGSQTISSLALVANAPTIAAGAAIAANPGAPTGPLTLATIAAAASSPDPALGFYTATVDWGDGSAPEVATIVAGAGGTLEVRSTGHVYTSASTTPYTIVTIIRTSTGTVIGSTAETPQLATVSALAIVTPPAVLLPNIVAGTPVASFVLGTITVPLTATSTLDPNGYTATVDFGDGSAPAAAFITAGTGAPGTVVLTITAPPHTFGRVGTFAATIVVRDSAGVQVAPAAALSLVSAAPTLTPGSVTVKQGVALINAVIATLTGPGGLDSANYTATVDWADGSAPTPATLTGTGTVSVLGSHIYGVPGTYSVLVTIRSAANAVVATATVPVTVTPAGSVAGVTAFLNPASDSGQSNTDYITKVVQPNFFGLTQAGATVQLFIKVAGTTGLGVPIGTTAADAAGAWSITSTVALFDATYTVTAVATTPQGTTASTQLPKSLVIDSTSPVINGVVVRRVGRTIQITFTDNLSGLDQFTLANGQNYVLTASNIPLHPPVSANSLRSTGISISAAASATSPQTVTLSFGRGRRFLDANYLFQVIAGGISDVAGNGLAGTFYGTYPTGNGQPGDYAAKFFIGYGKVAPLQPVVSLVSPGQRASATRAKSAPRATAAAKLHAKAAAHAPKAAAHKVAATAVAHPRLTGKV